MILNISKPNRETIIVEAVKNHKNNVADYFIQQFETIDIDLLYTLITESINTNNVSFFESLTSGIPLDPSDATFFYDYALEKHSYDIAIDLEHKVSSYNLNRFLIKYVLNNNIGAVLIILASYNPELDIITAIYTAESAGLYDMTTLLMNFERKLEDVNAAIDVFTKALTAKNYLISNELLQYIPINIVNELLRYYISRNDLDQIIYLIQEFNLDVSSALTLAEENNNSKLSKQLKKIFKID